MYFDISETIGCPDIDAQDASGLDGDFDVILTGMPLQLQAAPGQGEELRHQQPVSVMLTLSRHKYAGQ